MQISFISKVTRVHKATTATNDTSLWFTILVVWLGFHPGRLGRNFPYEQTTKFVPVTEPARLPGSYEEALRAKFRLRGKLRLSDKFRLRRKFRLRGNFVSVRAKFRLKSMYRIIRVVSRRLIKILCTKRKNYGEIFFFLWMSFIQLLPVTTSNGTISRSKQVCYVIYSVKSGKHC